MNVLKIRLGLLCLVMFTSAFTFNLKAQCNCTNSVTNPTTTSEFGTSTTITGYCKKITGTFTIDHDMEFINSNLDMQPGSQIYINSNVKLILNHTVIKNCSSWERILLSNKSSKIDVINNSEIIGASSGIQTFTGGTITISDSKLTNNNVCIDITDSVTVNISNSNLSATNYCIYFDKPRLSNMTISNCTFTTTKQGIVARKGGLNLSIDNNCNFICNTRAINLSNIVGNKAIKNSKFKNTDYSAILISDNDGATITNDSFDNCYLGVSITTTTTDINISNNYLNKCPFGIWLNGNTGFNNINIKNNKLDIIDSTGILLQGILSSPNQQIEISNNNIDSCRYGVNLQSTNNVKVISNIISKINSKGLLIINTSNSTFKWNTLVGTNHGNNEAISINLSMGNSFSCNTTNHTFRGFRSTNSCGNSFLYANFFREHNTGLRIDDGSFIGKQIHHWNSWLDTTHYTNLGAENLNSLPGDVLFSEFTVATPINTAYHPSNTGNGFFKLDVIPTPWVIKDCLQTVPEDQERNDNLFLMTNGYSSNTPEAKMNGWESKRYVYNELKEHPEYLQHSSNLTTFYLQLANSSIASFYEVRKAIIEGRYSDADLINAAITTSEIYESNLKTVYQLLSQTTLWTATQTQSLLSIANQCPDQGGSAVFLARDLYICKVDNTANFENTSCSTISFRSATDDNLLTTISVVPNPASNSVHISNLPSNGTVKVEILNTQGYLLDTKCINTSNNSLDLNIQNFASGIYFVRISNNDHFLATTKLVIIK